MTLDYIRTEVIQKVGQKNQPLFEDCPENEAQTLYQIQKIQTNKIMTEIEGKRNRGDVMVCKYSHYVNGKPVCKKDMPMQLLRCMGKGKPLPCYKPREEVKKHEKK